MKKILTFVAAAMMFTTLAGASAFADQRSPEGTWRDGQSRRDDGREHFRDNERVTAEGRVARVVRERGGFRIELDRGGYPYWVPESRLGGRDLRVGVSVRIHGTFRGDIVYVDDLGYDDGYGYGYNDNYGNRDGVVRGVVTYVNYRLHYLYIREFDGDTVKVDLRPIERRRREPDTDDLRRGDRVAIYGDWGRDGLFRAGQVERLRRW